MQLKQYYNNIIKEEMMERYNHQHSFQVGKLKRITVGLSLRNRQFNIKHLPAALVALLRLTGQMPTLVETKSSVSSYRRMKGDLVGVKVHLTGDNMLAFLNHRTGLVLPQIRPFYGFSESMVDAKGNITFPLKQPMVFPALEKFYEVLLPLCSKTGLYVTRETDCSSRDESIALLTALQVPIVSKEK